MQFLAELKSRGLFQQVSQPDLDARLAALTARGTVVAYAGFDPTADSLHVGNFMGIMALMHAQRNGIRSIAVHTGISTRDDLLAYAPDLLLKDLRGVVHQNPQPASAPNRGGN